MHHRSARPLGLAVALALLAGAFAALASPAFVAAQTAPTITGRSCAAGEGVTVVVDAQQLGAGVEVGCAPGQQADGFAALAAAGFGVNEDPGALGGTVCQIDRLPAAGYPTCWNDGFWASWKSDGTQPWSYADVGPASGPLAAGRVEAWSWTSPIPADYSGTLPRVPVSDLAALSLGEPDCAAGPEVPTFDIVDDDEVLPATLSDGHPVEVALLAADADPATATWTQTDEVVLAGRAGETRVLARRAGTDCPGGPTFDATYDVRGAYAPRWNADAPGGPSPAVDKADPAILGWATGHSEYTPGAGVNPSFQVPSNAYGSVDGSLVVLGDRGTITMTFDRPLADGEGYDLALFENGFAVGAVDFLELGYVEVSSDGETFVRFDSASRRATPVGAFVGQAPSELGGLAGKDLSGKGTPFDLSLLRNTPEVRSGAVDLLDISHVRVRDIKGDGQDLDSFGRPIHDPDPTTGSAGFDLNGIAVLNERDQVAPVVEITEAPTGTVTTGEASVVFTVDDDAATVEAKVDGGDWAAATSPLALTGLLDGEHTVEVRATDPTGNVGSDTATWTVDLPLSAPASWVTALHVDLLDREPTATELADAVARLEGGTSRAVIARELARSDEWVGTVVTRFYVDTLGRQPDASGKAFWVDRILTGTATVAQVAAAFYASPEYHGGIGGGTDATWVADLFTKLLHRDATTGDVTYWTARIQARGRTIVAREVFGSLESRRDRVTGLYEALLGRAPDVAGRDFWADRLARQDDLALAVHLVTSAEYATRAVTRFP